jgi:DNA-binding MarR family transcriptional regulator
VREVVEPKVRVAPTFEAEWPGASGLATECVLNLSYLSSQMTTFGESLIRTLDIPSLAAFNVLTILEGAGEPLPPSTIAERMIVTRPTMTGIIGTLERRGLARRLPHPTDRRMALIEISAEGIRRVLELRRRLHEAERNWMSCLSDQEQRLLISLVARLQASAPAP